MAAFSELFGKNGAIEQLLLWGAANQVISSMGQPAFIALTQDVMSRHPNMVLAPEVLARAVAQAFMDKAAAKAEATKSGINATRFDILLNLAEVRLTPADLAEAVLRSYEDNGSAEAEARQQGVTAKRFGILKLLAGDGIGPQQAAEALRRKLMPAKGKGPAAVTYEQAIAESRLHDKWGDVLFELTRAVLSPQDAASAVVRGFLAFDAGERIAELSGVSPDQFRTMVDLAADAPSPTALAEALRRGVIPENSGDPNKPGFVQGIQEGRLADKWIPMVKALAQLWPTPADALEARLVGQVDTEESKNLYARFGGDPKYWQLLFDTRGEAPTPLELGVLANRGIIPWTGTGSDVVSFEQGVHETRWRNKYLPAFRALAEYRPPETIIVTFLSHGIISNEEAADALAKLGMTPGTVAMFLREAHFTEVSQYRGATVDTILQAFHEQLLTADQANQILTDLHVDPLAAKIMIELQDIQRAFQAVNNVVSRIRTLYAARKITLATVTDALNKLGIPASSVQGMTEAWQIENSVSVKVLTEAQIADAFKEQFLTQDEAITELANLGYTPFDAWLILSLKAKQALPNKPAQGPAPPQGQVIPGTT